MQPLKLAKESLTGRLGGIRMKHSLLHEQSKVIMCMGEPSKKEENEYGNIIILCIYVKVCVHEDMYTNKLKRLKQLRKCKYKGKIHESPEILTS